MSESTIRVNNAGGNDIVDVTEIDSNHRTILAGDGTIVGKRDQDEQMAYNGETVAGDDDDDVEFDEDATDATGDDDDETFTGNDDDNEIHGGGGEDDIDGGHGNDRLCGGNGDDDVDGGGGNDSFVASVSDGNDIYSGGSGIDTYDASAATEGVRLNLRNGTATGSEIGSDSLTGIENLTGGSGHDYLAGNNLNNSIRGNGGNDVIYGYGGNDRLIGGAGNDKVYGGAGNDRFVATTGDGNDHYHGGSGTDTYDASATTAGVRINLTTGRATGSEIGSDRLTSIEKLFGGSGRDVLIGNGSDNVIKGNAGNDRLSGGDGNDRFVFSKGFGNDVVSDFDALAAGGQDKLDLRAMGIGSADFANRVDIIDQGNDVLLRIDDINTIKLKNVSDVNSVTVSDFVLFG